MKLANTIALLALFATPSFALQGDDSCATPTAIAGTGAFAFDTSTATTGAEAQMETICYAFGSSGVDNDVWFEWTSDIDGVAVMTIALIRNLILHGQAAAKDALWAGTGCGDACLRLDCLFRCGLISCLCPHLFGPVRTSCPSAPVM